VCPVDGKFSIVGLIKSLINFTHSDLFYYNNFMFNFSSLRQLMVIYSTLII